MKVELHMKNVCRLACYELCLLGEAYVPVNVHFVSMNVWMHQK